MWKDQVNFSEKLIMKSKKYLNQQTSAGQHKVSRYWNSCVVVWFDWLTEVRDWIQIITSQKFQMANIMNKKKYKNNSSDTYKN